MLSLSSPGIGDCAGLKFGQAIGSAERRNIERRLHLDYDKWDTQVGDVSVLLEQPLIIAADQWDLLCEWSERLWHETLLAESAVLNSEADQVLIGIPEGLRDLLNASKTPVAAVRGMRFDFHPTSSGWRISEVNSDVPGGWREGTTLPLLYQPFYEDFECAHSPLEAWGSATAAFLAKDELVALLCAPGHLEDEQVVRSFVRELSTRDIRCAILRSPGALDWSSSRCRLTGNGTRVSLIVRFYQAEWLSRLPVRTGWRELLGTTSIPVINPTNSTISESKRFPLLLGDIAAYPTWAALLPECRDPRSVEPSDWSNWVLKRCYSNTGDSVHICADMVPKERERLIRTVRRNHVQWVAQKAFQTLLLPSCRGPLRPCIGVFVINGRASGAYVRLSHHQVTDGAALEAPLLIDRRLA